MRNGTGALLWVRVRQNVGWSGKMAMVTGSSVSCLLRFFQMGLTMRSSRYCTHCVLSFGSPACPASSVASTCRKTKSLVLRASSAAWHFPS